MRGRKGERHTTVNDSNRPRSETRSNALWGSNSRGGDTRSNAMWGRSGRRANALWGRGGRSLVLAVVAALTIIVPLGATASDNSGPGKNATFISPGLLKNADKNPGQKLHVIVQSTAGSADASAKLRGVGASVRKQLNLIGAVAVDVTAGKLTPLPTTAGLTITADAPTRLSGTINY